MIQCPLQTVLKQPRDIFIWDHGKRFFSICTFSCVVQPTLYLFISIAAIFSIPHAIRRRPVTAENVSLISFMLLPAVHLWQVISIISMVDVTLDSHFCIVLKGALGFVSSVMFIIGGGGISLIQPEIFFQKLYWFLYLLVIVFNMIYASLYWVDLPQIERYFCVSLLVIIKLCITISGLCVSYARYQGSSRTRVKTIFDHLGNFLFIKGFPLLYYGTRKYSRSLILEVPNILSIITININASKLGAHLKRHYRLMTHVLRLYGIQIFLIGVLYLTHIGNSFAKAMILERLITAFSEKQDTVTIAVSSTFLVLSCAVCFLSDTYYSYHTSILALSIEASLQKLLYKYVLESTADANSDENVGKVCSILSTDLKRFSNVIRCLHPLLWSPVQIIVGFYLLYRHLGLTFFVGVFVAGCLIPFNHAISSRIQKLASIILEWRDIRMKLISELLEKFVGIKLYGLDGIFYNKIIAARINELKYLKQRKYLDALCVVSWATLTTVVAFSSFATYSFSGNDFSASKVFGSIAIFNILLYPLNSLPWYINGIIEAVVSEKRVSNFFFDLECQAVSNPVFVSNKHYLFLEKCFFSWSSSLDIVTLRDITISLKEGELLGITGHNASGKSSFLMALGNKLYMSSGSFYMRPQPLIFSIAPQNPWIYEGTLKENILMGSEFDSLKYERVVKACCLDADIKGFPNSDDHLISHNGINLSGGQKTRVALARCLYKDADVYLLDDPLKDVDAIVAQKIMKHAFMGYLRGKTRVLCFTDSTYSNFIHKIVVLENGKIQKITKRDPVLIEFDYDTPTVTPLKRLSISDENFVQDPSITETYEHNEGYVKASVYWKYALNIGPWCLLLVAVSPILMQASLQSTNSWLSYIVSYWQNYNSVSRWNGMIIYCELVGFLLVFAFLRAFSFAYGTYVASRKIHDSFLRSIIKRAPTCVDEVSISDTVNRFSTDLYGIDFQLPFILNIFLASAFSFMGTIVIILSSAPYFIIVAIPLSILCILAQVKYREFASFLKRMSLNDLTPIYNSLIESILGCKVIEIMGCKSWFLDRFEGYISTYITSQYTLFYMEQWLSITMNVFGLLMIIAILTIINLMNFFDVGEAFLVNLSIAYLIQFTGSISSLFSSFINTDQLMIHAERILECTFESKTGINSKEEDKICKGANYDSSVVLEYKDVIVRYHNGFCPYPEGLNIKFGKGLTIGICGTTGAGKSSIFKALFGLAPVTSGEIILRGDSFRNYTRHQLNRICYILPQDPVVFDNSFRFNLDPMNEFTDEQLWNVLEETDLCTVLEKNHANLYSEIGSGLLTLTHGQKQLLCIGRALLHKSEIIFLDEATSSADEQTEQKVWSIIHKHFRNSTVIIIAHRLTNVISADKVVVLDGGKVIEYDDPEKLLQNESSRFSKLRKLQQESAM